MITFRRWDYIQDVRILALIFIGLLLILYRELNVVIDHNIHHPENKQSHGAATNWRFRSRKNDISDPLLQFLPGNKHAWERLDERIAHLDMGPVLTLPAADFDFSVRLTRAQQKMAGFSQKYFTETGPSGHFDGRFYREPLGRTYSQVAQVKVLQKDLFSAWYKFTSTYEIPYWLNHGTLLSWVWNKDGFPWDVDIDVTTTMRGLYQLQERNQTRWQDRYLVDVDFHWWHRTENKYEHVNNRIDARFVDMQSGAFIDITGLWRNHSNQDGMLFCKDGHHYKLEQISPLHLTSFMGTPAWRPHRPKEMLAQEYGWLSIVRPFFYNYYFNSSSWQWERDLHFPLPVLSSSIQSISST